jgi:hypothetical protein
MVGNFQPFAACGQARKRVERMSKTVPSGRWSRGFRFRLPQSGGRVCLFVRVEDAEKELKIMKVVNLCYNDYVSMTIIGEAIQQAVIAVRQNKYPNLGLLHRVPNPNTGRVWKNSLPAIVHEHLWPGDPWEQISYGCYLKYRPASGQPASGLAHFWFGIILFANPQRQPNPLVCVWAGGKNGKRFPKPSGVLFQKWHGSTNGQLYLEFKNALNYDVSGIQSDMVDFLTEIIGTI